MSTGAAKPANGAPHDGGLALGRDTLMYLIPPTRLGGFVHALRTRLRFHYFTGDVIVFTRREGVRSNSRRVRLDTRHPLGAALQGGGDADARTAILAFAAEFGELLAPSCVVGRIAFEDEPGQLCVTLDVELAFYAPVLVLWTPAATLSGSGTAQPFPGAPPCLVEIEQRAGTPEWLSRALDIARAIPECLNQCVMAAEPVRGRD